MSGGAHNSAHSAKWAGPSSRANRQDLKIRRVVQPISLRRLESLLADQKKEKGREP
jgi:hypothetical protein